jgi:hypothetical protein
MERSQPTNNDHSAEPQPASLGLRLYRFLLDPDVKDNLQRPIENFIAILILANVGAMAIEHIPQVYEPNKKWFHFFDTVSIIIFTVEYLTRFALAPYQKEFIGKRLPRLMPTG